MQVIQLLNFSSTNLITNQRTRFIIQISNLLANKGDFYVESLQKIQTIIQVPKFPHPYFIDISMTQFVLHSLTLVCMH